MGFQLTILGSGSATPTLWRNPTAQILHADGDNYLIDCGEGTQLQLLKYKLRPGRLKYIFISHLHGDHYFGLIGLLTSLSLSKRTDDLWLFGPAGLDEIITLQLKHSDTRLSYFIHFQSIVYDKAYTFFENDCLSVEAIPLKHRIQCSGFLFREKPRKRKIIKELLPDNLTHEQMRLLKDGYDVTGDSGQVLFQNTDLTTPSPEPLSYAYCSDTIYQESIIEQIKHVDLLYHEATFPHSMLERATKTYHTTAWQAAQVAQKAVVGQLIIGHFSSRFKDVTLFLEEAQAVFPRTNLAVEGTTYSVRESDHSFFSDKAT